MSIPTQGVDGSRFPSASAVPSRTGTQEDNTCVLKLAQIQFQALKKEFSSRI